MITTLDIAYLILVGTLLCYKNNRNNCITIGISFFICLNFFVQYTLNNYSAIRLLKLCV